MVKCSEVVQRSDVLSVLFITLYTVVGFVYFCLILYVMCSYCYVYAFLLLRTFRSVYSVFIVPTGTLQLP